MTITANELRTILNYDADTGVFTWRISACNRALAGSLAGYTMRSGYIRICIKKKFYMAHRLAWLYVYGDFPELDIDHINMLKADNRIANLRQATDSENVQNTGLRSTNTSGFKGVSFDKRTKKWQAALKLMRKTIRLGMFDTPELASEAYIAGVSIYHTRNPLQKQIAASKGAA